MLKGKDGAKQIAQILVDFRNNPPKEIVGLQVVTVEDYQASTSVNFVNGTEEEIFLPRSNVLKCYLENGSWFCLRPSGTESKIKFYFGVKGNSLEESEQLIEELQISVMNLVNYLIEVKL